MRVKLHLAYEGTHYYGWQKQAEEASQPTVQEKFEGALKALTQASIKVQGSGRTDRGVHALDQVIHFDLPDGIDFKNYDWIKGLNRHLPEDIRVQFASPIDEDFHATKSALSKTYTYQIQDGESPNPLISRFSHWVQSPIDLDYMNSLSEVFLGRHDFKSFQTVGTELYTTVRSLKEFKWTRRASDGLILIQITGDGFLKQMVRNLMGSLLHQYWKKPFTPDDMLSILAQKDRTKAKGTAPAKGLILSKVHYPENLTKRP